jgi:hypothetical protein
MFKRTFSYIVYTLVESLKEWSAQATHSLVHQVSSICQENLRSETDQQKYLDVLNQSVQERQNFM